jgi:pimeloyl-ACP methyl ester carboxylesterase
MNRALENTRINLKGFRRIYIDLPGMGQSPRHNLENNSDTMLTLLCKFIPSIIGDHPFIILGYSYGGYLAQGIASKFRNQLLGEVLICPVIVPEPEKRKKASITNREIDAKFLSTITEEKQHELLNSMVVINERTFKRSESDFSRASALADSTFLNQLHTSGYTSEYIESNTGIHSHKALIFLGYQDKTVGYEDMMSRLNRYPKATVNLLTNASHSFFLEQPTQFEYILNSWLSQYKL